MATKLLKSHLSLPEIGTNPRFSYDVPFFMICFIFKVLTRCHVCIQLLKCHILINSLLCVVTGLWIPHLYSKVSDIWFKPTKREKKITSNCAEAMNLCYYCSPFVASWLSAPITHCSTTFLKTCWERGKLRHTSPSFLSPQKSFQPQPLNPHSSAI